MSTYDANSKDILVTYTIPSGLWLNMTFIQRVLSFPSSTEFVSQFTRGLFQSGEYNIRTSQIPKYYISLRDLIIL